MWARARREDLGLVAMKVLGGQTGEQGYRLPSEQYRNAIRYALSLPGISCAVIGTETVAELQQAAEAVADFEPLADEESHALARLGLKLAGMPAWKTAYGTPLT